MNTAQLLEKIKEKKEFKNIDDSLIYDILDEYSEKYKLNLENLDKFKAKIVIKEIRAKLRLYTGRFQKSLKDRLRLLEENKIEELLKTHSSTAERINFYSEIKKLIKNLKIKSILDLGCGINPIALANKDIEYYAADINKSDLLLIERFFEKNKINGKTFVYDLRKVNENLPKADICLIFKTLDIIEKKSHKLAEKIIKTVKCRYFLISFATRTLSGRHMKYKRRIWLEALLKNLGYKYEVLNSNNEIFYFFQKLN